MSSDILKKSLLLLSLVTLPIFAVVFWRALDTEPTLATLTETADKAGAAMLDDLRSIPAKEIKEEEESYIIEEDGKDGIDISFASSAVIASESSSAAIQDSDLEAKPLSETKKTTLSLPKDYGKPIEVRLDEQRIVLITDLNGSGDYSSAVLSDGEQGTGNREQGTRDSVIPSDSSVIARESSTAAIQEKSIAKDWIATLFRQNGTARNDEQSLGGSTSKYLSYTSPDERKTHLYAYQKDQATGEKKLKSWTLYNYGLGKETESYKIENAKIKLDEDGNADVFFFGQSDIQSEQAKADVDPDLMDRAQKFLEQETGNDIMNDTARTPDFTIPKPKYFTKDGQEKESDWTWDETTKTLSVALTENPDAYPIALDPTLSFTAPGSTAGGDAITGEEGSEFSSSLSAGDFNADGKTDLAVSASGYPASNYIGRVYIFYQDGLYSTTAAFADVIVTGDDYDEFGSSLSAGDFNADGKMDLAVGASGYLAGDYTGRVYIFYQDGSYPTAASSADIIITGEAGSYFGYPLSAGDWNADGRTDLVVGAVTYSANTGRAYIFWSGSITTENASGADIIITGEATSSFFATAFVSGDFNADGKTDLAVGARNYSTGTGRSYIFYNGSITTENASGADIIITGEATNNDFGTALAAGDFNQDGKTDLVVGASIYSSSTGRVYIFYSGSIITESASGADIIITGEASSQFGRELSSGDFSQDGKTDLVVGADGYSASIGRAYIFYNGSIVTEAATGADIIITGEATSYFGRTISAGDFNADGKTDLAVGAYGYASNTGKVYLFYSQNGTVNTNKSIVGEATNNSFGNAFAAGDFNADGKTDLAVGAEYYDSANSNTGRVYLFYNDGSYPTAGASADAIITGEAASDLFGHAIASGDFNADGKTDLVVGAYGYSTSTGRAYLFYSGSIITENASGADVIITGEATDNYFGYSFAAGDFNADGKTDLAAGAYKYSSFVGRAYIFYNGSIITENASGADVIITGEASSNFGFALVAGDFSADGRMDLSVSAMAYSSLGRTYFFYNDGSIPTTAATADVIITGEGGQFGYSLAVGDFNADGRTDIVAGANMYNSQAGRTYVFYADGTNNFGTVACSGTPAACSATNADVIVVGEASSNFGQSLVAGDFNADGRVDLTVGATIITTNTGKAYIFHNDGSSLGTVACTTSCLAANADTTIIGETTSNSFGTLVSDDFNADGRADLVVGAPGNTTNTGKIYFYETRENFAWQVQPVSGLRTSPNFSGQEMKITGESGTTGEFGNAFVTGDFNADGKIDLAVGAYAYNSSVGRAYLFYGDNSLSPGASSADVIISGEATGNQLSWSLASGDFNADGKMDFAIGANEYSSSTGRVYIFYNDNSYPSTAAAADIIITGEASSRLGAALAAGDFNADGKTDLVVGASTYSSFTGRAYIFYSGSIITENASGADVIIQGETTSNSFGDSLVSGDLNADGKTDLVVGAYQYSSSTGRAYIFYSGSIITENASGADVKLTGESSSNDFSYSFAVGDLNNDGKTDLVVGADRYDGYSGRIYAFYGGSMVTEVATGADVIITGESWDDIFGTAIVVGDFNSDGRADVAVGAKGYDSFDYTGRVYLFYNDGSYPVAAASADIILTGETYSNAFSAALAAGDFNADGKTDLIVGAYGYDSNKGRAYLYTFNDGVITGETTDNSFGSFLANGDFNADGRVDLAIGASGYDTGSSDVGRVYLFYNDGLNYPTDGASADIIITGEAASNSFGASLASGDFNADGKTDLAVGAYGYSSSAGRAYIFYSGSIITENASGADVIITGETTSDYYGITLAVGDFNADGKTDLVAGAGFYPSAGLTGRAYIFYSGSIITENASGADVIITGEASSAFGGSLTSGDFNADGKTDLAVGATLHSTSAGRVYIFYSGSIITENASGADVIITGETTSSFGSVFAGDLNADGKTDLVVGASAYNTNTGRIYIFYSGSIITENASGADVIITGETTNNYFGGPITLGDFDQDGKTDLAVGAYGYTTNTGRAYIFYNDGFTPTIAASADIILTGQTTSNNYGGKLMSGDFNQDGKIDLVIGAASYTTNTGRVYITITEARSAPTDQALKIRGGFKTKGGFRVR